MALTGADVLRIGDTRYATKVATPVQSALNPTEQGGVVLDFVFGDGLAELDGFVHVWLLTCRDLRSGWLRRVGWR